MRNNLVLTTLAILALIGTTQAQTPVHTNALKLYNHSIWHTNTTESRDGSGFSIQNTITQSQVVRPTLAYQWSNSPKTFHEIELTQLRIEGISDRSDRINDTTGRMEPIPNGGEIRTAEFSVRYEYNFNLNRSAQQKLIPWAGIALNPYFRRNEQIPGNSNSFRTAQTISGALAFFIPRLTYNLSDHFFVDFNMPICLLDNQLDVMKVENPMFNKDQQKNSTYNFEVLPGVVSLRLGIGLRI